MVPFFFVELGYQELAIFNSAVAFIGQLALLRDATEQAHRRGDNMGILV
jgi:hypothetical protein